MAAPLSTAPSSGRKVAMACARLDMAAAASLPSAPLRPCLQKPAREARPGKLGGWCRGGRLSRHHTGFPWRRRRNGSFKITAAALSDLTLRDQVEAAALSSPGGPDLFILDLAERLEDSVAQEDGKSSILQRLHENSSEVVVSSRWPTSKDEAYRFTDLRFLKKSEIEPCQGLVGNVDVDLSSLIIDEAEKSKVVFVDGFFSPLLSKLEDLPEEVYVGSVSAAPPGLVEKYVLPRVACTSGQDVFASLNGVGARDLFLILVPAEFKLFDLLHVLYISTGAQTKDENAGSSFSLSSPRLLVAVGKGGEMEFVEEFVAAGEAGGGSYWTNAVCEVIVDEGANVIHRYVQEQRGDAVHMKQTSVSQAANSCYKHVEIGLGGRLSRHNLHIDQLGPDTITEISTFQLAGQNQLHDLHSELVLSHPGGFARQLHKCIVSESSGHGVFDGNVKVNRYAQQTDAGQLSRSLLLAPRATVNVKPNLQIVADDVKCSHGAAISDFEAEQLFYFQSRGIDAQTARSALVFSFGAEVVERLVFKSLRKRVETLMKTSLAEVAVIDASAPS